jgi:hypothetical protein
LIIIYYHYPATSRTAPASQLRKIAFHLRLALLTAYPHFHRVPTAKPRRTQDKCSLATKSQKISTYAEQVMTATTKPHALWRFSAVPFISARSAYLASIHFLLGDEPPRYHLRLILLGLFD